MLVSTATVTHSASRGDAQHFTIKAGDRTAEDAALGYADSPIAELRDLIRLEWDAMDGWFEEDEEVYPPARPLHPRRHPGELAPGAGRGRGGGAGRVGQPPGAVRDRPAAALVPPYRTTLPESQKIAGLVAFYNEEVDLFVDDRLQERPVTKFSRRPRKTGHERSEHMPDEHASRTRLERILGVRLAEDAVRQWPQSGELLEGRAHIGEVESHFVGLRLGVGRRHALGDTIVVEWSTD
jgi:uncharacterized protein (DUF427 family)